ncbi:hypothetical protein [Pseudomonas laurylsulfatiphila]|uniref:hypothetical protein n=1 Tax=Pseudomonas laurylsulfatiphila TaxID=2011015 RepID=UPI00215FAEF4|nr:hypothetical protein [Pseudomonas laurylsulfatiphila]UVM06403.1 hypothetical protein LOY25_06795 [Pseudomonas laurylsulfatiphila]
MEPIRIHSYPKTTEFAAVAPLTELELELLTKYRRLSSDDQQRVLSVLQAMASLNQVE